MFVISKWGKGVSRLLSVSDTLSDEEWDRLAGSARYASFFDSSRYAKACEESFPNTVAAARHYRFDDGVEVLVPGIAQTALRGAVRVFKSIGPSDSSGLLSASALDVSHVDAIAADLTNCGYAHVTIYDSPYGLHPPLAGFQVTEDLTHVIDLKRGLDGFVQNMNPPNRQALRRAHKSDVRIERRNDIGAVDEFYRLYLDSVERWGDKATWVRPREYLEALVRHGEDGSVCIRLAYLEDLAIGGQVDYRFGSISTTGWRAFDYRYRSMYPNLLTLEAAVAEECEKGCEYHDMGPSAGLTGLEDSKDRCGGLRLGFRVWTWESSSHKAYRLGRGGLDRAQAAVHSLTRR